MVPHSFVFQCNIDFTPYLVGEKLLFENNENIKFLYIIFVFIGFIRLKCVTLSNVDNKTNNNVRTNSTCYFTSLELKHILINISLFF